MFKIEKSVPIPQIDPRFDGSTLGSTPLYPFKDMQVGDSFFVPKSVSKKAFAAARVHKHRHKVGFIMRPYGDGYRIWRTE